MCNTHGTKESLQGHILVPSLKPPVPFSFYHFLPIFNREGCRTPTKPAVPILGKNCLHQTAPKSERSEPPERSKGLWSPLPRELANLNHIGGAESESRSVSLLAFREPTLHPLAARDQAREHGGAANLTISQGPRGRGKSRRETVQSNGVGAR
jgi:hypothetical protein